MKREVPESRICSPGIPTTRFIQGIPRADHLEAGGTSNTTKSKRLGSRRCHRPTKPTKWSPGIIVDSIDLPGNANRRIPLAQTRTTAVIVPANQRSRLPRNVFIFFRIGDADSPPKLNPNPSHQLGTLPTRTSKSNRHSPPYPATPDDAYACQHRAAVNLLAYAFPGSNPGPTTNFRRLAELGVGGAGQGDLGQCLRHLSRGRFLSRVPA